MAKSRAGLREKHMDARRQELGMSWDELAQRAGTSLPTLRKVRRGEGDNYPRVVRNIEAALGWALGSLATIDVGGEPTIVDSDLILRTPMVDVYRPGPVPQYLDPVTKDVALGPLLRDIRRRMGAAAFWREIGTMQAEEDTESDRGTGT